MKGLDLLEPVEDQPVEMILGCENLKLFEAIKPSSLRGPTDPVAWLTPLGWMAGGKTYPEPAPDAEGDPGVITGESGVAQGQLADSQVSSNESLNKEKEITNQDLLPNHQCQMVGCDDKCQRDYEQLRNNMRRVWELESEEELRRLMNSHCPAVKTERQKRAEAILRENLKQLPNGQYQTRLLWKTDQRPHNNYEAAKKAFFRV